MSMFMMLHVLVSIRVRAQILYLKNQEDIVRLSRVYIDGYFIDFSVAHDAFKADQEHVIGKSVNGQLPLRWQFTMPHLLVFCLRELCYLGVCMFSQCILPQDGVVASSPSIMCSSLTLFPPPQSTV